MTPQASMSGSSVFNTFPDEILLRIAEYVWISSLEEFEALSNDDTDVSTSGVESSSDADSSSESSFSCLFSTHEKLEYEDLVVFCLVSKACRRTGQEVLFRNLDLTTEPIKHLLGVLRTLLLDMPALSEKVISIRWKVPPGIGVFEPGSCEDASTLRESDEEALLQLLDLLNWVKDSKTINEVPSRPVRAQDSLAWIRLLITSTPRLKKLDVTVSANGCLTQVVHDISSMCGLGKLGHLEHLCLRSPNGDNGLILPILMYDDLLRLPTLKTLELRPTGSLYKDSFGSSRHPSFLDVATKLEEDELPRIYEIDNLILHDQSWSSYSFLKTFTTLTSLTLVLKRYQGPGSEDQHLPEIPDLLACKLEHLRLQFRRGYASKNEPDVGLYFWPHGLSTLTTLKTLHMEGGFFLYHMDWCQSLYGKGSFANICIVASDFFPPNIQELAYLPDRIETARLVEQHQPLDELIKEERPGPKVIGNFCIREFLKHAVDTRQSLRKVTVSSDLYNRLGFGELIDQLAGAGVEMFTRAQDDEEKDLDHMYGGIWRDWLAESLGAPVEFESDIERYYRVNGLGDLHDE